MPLRRRRSLRRRSGRRFQRRTRRRSMRRGGFRRSVSRIANRSINRRIETKMARLPRDDAFIMLDDFLYVHNPTWNIPEGTGDAERIGRKIQNAFMTVSFRYRHLGQSPLGPTFPRQAEDSHLRMLVIRGQPHAPTSVGFDPDPVGVQDTDVFLDPASMLVSPVDTNRWKVVFDRVFHVTSVEPQTTQAHPGHTIIVRNIHIPWGKQLVYWDETADGTQSRLKGSTQYLLFTASFSGANNTGERIGLIDFSCQFRYKDA